MALFSTVLPLSPVLARSCLMGFECHFDAVIFQNSLYWLRGPANVWNCAVASPGFCRVNYVLQRRFRLAGIQDEALGVSIGL